MFRLGKWVVPLEENLLHLPRQRVVTPGIVVDRVGDRVSDQVIDRVVDHVVELLLLVESCTVLRDLATVHHLHVHRVQRTIKKNT
jgi:hypothetical protein